MEERIERCALSLCHYVHPPLYHRGGEQGPDGYGVGAAANLRRSNCSSSPATSPPCPWLPLRICPPAAFPCCSGRVAATILLFVVVSLYPYCRRRSNQFRWLIYSTRSSALLVVVAFALGALRLGLPARLRGSSLRLCSPARSAAAIGSVSSTSTSDVVVLVFVVSSLSLCLQNPRSASALVTTPLPPNWSC